MAESKVEIALIANARKLVSGLKEGERGAKRFFDTVKKHQQSLRKVALGATAALAGQLYMLKKMADAAGVQQQAEKDLEVALRQQGETRKSVIQGLIDHAAALQKTSTFGDEAIITGQAFMANMGVTADKLPMATNAVVDMAAALGWTLQQAALNVGKTMGGLAGELGEVIPELKELTPEALKAGAGIQLISDKFSGQAAAQVDTYAGRLKQLGLAVGDLQEAIGFALIPMIMQLIVRVKPIIEKTVEWFNSNRKLVGILTGVGVGGTGLIVALTTLGFILPGLAVGFNLMLGPLGLVTLGLTALAAAVTIVILKSKGLPESVEEFNSAITRAEEQIAVWDQRLKDGLVTYGQWETETRALTEHIKDLETELANLEVGTDAVTAATEEAHDAHYRLWLLLGQLRERIGSLVAIYDEVAPRHDEEAEFWTNLYGRVKEAERAMAEYGEQSATTSQQVAADTEVMGAGMEQYATRASDTFTSTISDFLVADKSFKKALTAATIKVVALGLQAFIRAKIAEVTASMFTEKGKAAIGAPLSFGATLLALAPIAAAGAATIALLRAIKMPSFAMGGTVQRTGPAMVHEGEVIVNPRMPGKGQEALAAAGAGGVTVNFYGPVYDGVEEVKRGVARAIRGAR